MPQAEASSPEIERLRGQPPHAARLAEPPAGPVLDATETALRRRARRQGLALMIASALVVLVLIWLLWTGLTALL